MFEYMGDNIIRRDAMTKNFLDDRIFRFFDFAQNDDVSIDSSIEIFFG